MVAPTAEQQALARARRAAANGKEYKPRTEKNKKLLAEMYIKRGKNQKLLTEVEGNSVLNMTSICQH